MSTANQQQALLLQVQHLKMHFAIHKGILNRHIADVKAVDDVSFDIYHRETLALVGESGCGKTTIGRCIVRAYSPTAGLMLYRKQSGNGDSQSTNDDMIDGRPTARA
jgi:ABC-type oligopeptide transport system ATPase subunit